MALILVKGGIVVTMDPGHRILSDHLIIIEDGKSRAIGETREITKYWAVDETKWCFRQ